MKIKGYHKELKKWFWVEEMSDMSYDPFTIILVKNRFNKNGERPPQDEIQCNSNQVTLKIIEK